MSETSARDDGTFLGIVATQVHGRHLIAPPATRRPAPMMIGFHGYAEDADLQMRRLREIPGSEHWLIVSVQALYRFYTRKNDVVAGWMTRQDRDAAIADNIAYVDKTLAAVRTEWPSTEQTVFLGFSQGVSMAFRAAVHRASPTGVFAVAGTVPPELGAESLRSLTEAVLCRGTADDLYTAQEFVNDQERLRSAGVPLRTIELPGGHVWGPDVGQMAASMLKRFQTNGF